MRIAFVPVQDSQTHVHLHMQTHTKPAHHRDPTPHEKDSTDVTFGSRYYSAMGETL